MDRRRHIERWFAGRGVPQLIAGNGSEQPGSACSRSRAGRCGTSVPSWARSPTLVARTLPVLLILVVFLLFASGLVQAAHTLGGGALAAVIGLLLLVAAGLLGGICALYFTGLALTDAAFRAEPRARRW